MNKGTLYPKFQNAPQTISERFFVAHLDDCRLDSRLFEVMTEYIRDFWFILNPFIFNKELKKSNNGFLIKAIMSAISEYCEISNGVKSDFFEWYQISSRGVSENSKFSLLSKEDIKPGSLFEKRVIKESLPCFLIHKLYAKDLPFNKNLPKEVKDFDSFEKRFGILEMIKVKAVLKIKNDSIKMTNAELESKYKTNRVFVSRILNSSYDRIKIDFFEKVIGL